MQGSFDVFMAQHSPRSRVGSGIGQSIFVSLEQSRKKHE